MSNRISTAPYKLIYLGVILVMAAIIFVSSFFLVDDPRFKVISLITNLKRVYYTTSFMSANALGSMDDVSKKASTAPIHTVPVLVYHGILSKPDGSEINLTEEQFKEHMFALRRAGYTTITLPELYAFAHEGKPLPPKPILITFDDGRSDSFYKADPILDAVGYNAVMYVITDYADGAAPGGYYLSTDEVRLMAKNGRWEIGSHSAGGHDQERIDEAGNEGNFFSNHLWLPDQGRIETEAEFRKRIGDDFKRSKDYLEKALGTPITTFAFPFGDLGQNQLDNRDKSKDIIEEATAVYDMLLYQQSPGIYFTEFTPSMQNSTDKFFVRRINMQNSWSASELLDILHDGAEKPLPYTDTFNEDNGWITIWGNKTIKDNTFTLAAKPDSAGASTILDGSQHWGDYIVTAEVRSPAQTGIFLWARFQNDNAYAGCNFGTNFVHVEQSLNGEKRVLKGVARPNDIPDGWFTIQTEVRGRTLICKLNGIEIVRTDFLEPTLTHGGTGIKIWDSTLGKSSAIIRQFKAEEINSEE